MKHKYVLDKKNNNCHSIIKIFDCGNPVKIFDRLDWLHLILVNKAMVHDA